MIPNSCNADMAHDKSFVPSMLIWESNRKTESSDGWVVWAFARSSNGRLEFKDSPSKCSNESYSNRPHRITVDPASLKAFPCTHSFLVKDSPSLTTMSCLYVFCEPKQAFSLPQDQWHCYTQTTLSVLDSVAEL